MFSRSLAAGWSRGHKILLLLALAAPAAHADLRCPAIFSDHMVLQCGQPVTVWGESDPAAVVTVRFADQAKTTITDDAGHWRIVLDPLRVCSEPREMVISSARDEELKFHDVLVGEVWLCSGQSNMEKPLGPRKGQKPTDHYKEEIRAANFPQIRLFQMPHSGKVHHPQYERRWLRCSPETIRGTQFSAAAYYFGRELWRQLRRAEIDSGGPARVRAGETAGESHVPIGLIHSSFGGTMIEAWIPREGFAREPALRGLVTRRYQAWVDGVQATELYASMIAPLAPYGLRGFLWYQGEANCMDGDGAIYTDKMRALISSWRELWNEPDAPFYFAQIAPFNYSDWTTFPSLLTPEALPLFWTAQEAALEIPHTGMIATMDIAGDAHDIHPTNKRDVGLRFARLALADTYGRRGLVARSPRFASMQNLPDGRIEITFTNVGAGLRARDPAAGFHAFSIAGRDRRFVTAKVTIEEGGRGVIVSSPEMSDPVAVRFAWHETSNPNLVNSARLPALPFRTDDWPVVNVRERKAGSG